MSLALALYVLALAAVGLVAYFLYASFAYGAGYQPTPRAVVDRMLRLAELRPSDTVYDLGAGTGAILFRAARTYRARVVGVEVEPIRVLVLRLRRRFGPEKNRIEVVWGDFLRLDFRRATVVTLFLWPGVMTRLRAKFEEELAPGTRIVSYYHELPGYTPELVDRELRVYLYRWPDPAGRPVRPKIPTTGGSGTRS